MTIVVKKTLIPFAVFVIVVGFLGLGLNRKPGEVPSPFIGKPAANFSLPILITVDKPTIKSTISNADLAGKVWLFNVWASWCVACRDEHPLLIRLSQSSDVEIVGLNYKDTELDANRWLQEFGNPYAAIAFDQLGNVGIDYGVYGVPETFVIDKKGIVRLKHIGPLTDQDVQTIIIPMVNRLQEENS